MIGSTKLPSAAGMPGMMNRKIITAPCSVNMWLYVSADMIVGPGENNSVRNSAAKAPPKPSDAMIAIRYITPIRLWSSVNSQDAMPRVCVR